MHPSFVAIGREGHFELSWLIPPHAVFAGFWPFKRGSTEMEERGRMRGRGGAIWFPLHSRYKSECLKQAPPRSNGSAWNNGRGPASTSVGLMEAVNDQEERTGVQVWLGEK